jgi:hypothetical protein
LEDVRLSARKLDGSGLVEVLLSMSAPPSVVRMALPSEFFERTYEEVDLFECLRVIRADLEARGLLLCCQGARLDVFHRG